MAPVVEIPAGPSLSVPTRSVQDGDRLSGAMDFSDYHLDYADFEEEYITTYIQLADTKASIFGATIVGVLAYLAQYLHTVGELQFGILKIATIASYLLLLESAGYCFATIYPRIKNSSEGVVYWRSVFDNFKNADDFAQSIAKLAQPDLMKARIKHCYDIARVCSLKYDRLQVSMALGAIGLLFTVPFLLMIPQAQ